MTTLEKIVQFIGCVFLFIVALPAFCLYGICYGIRELIDFIKYCHENSTLVR
jgi:hypothetical protein